MMPRRVWPGGMESSVKWGNFNSAAPQILSVWGSEVRQVLSQTGGFPGALFSSTLMWVAWPHKVPISALAGFCFRGENMELYCDK